MTKKLIIFPTGKKGTIEDIEFGQPFFYMNEFWIRTDRHTGTHVIVNTLESSRSDNYRSCSFVQENDNLIEIDLVAVTV